MRNAVVAIVALAIALAATPAMAGFDSDENQENMGLSKPAYSGPGPGGSWGSTYGQRRFNVGARAKNLFGTVGTLMSQFLDQLANKPDRTITAVNHGWSVPSWHDSDNGRNDTGEWGDHDNMPSGCPHC